MLILNFMRRNDFNGENHPTRVYMEEFINNIFFRNYFFLWKLHSKKKNFFFFADVSWIVDIKNTKKKFFFFWWWFFFENLNLKFEKVAVTFENLKFEIWNFQMLTIWTHTLWVWWRNLHKNMSYVLNTCQKSTFITCFSTMSFWHG